MEFQVGDKVRLTGELWNDGDWFVDGEQVGIGDIVEIGAVIDGNAHIANSRSRDDGMTLYVNSDPDDYFSAELVERAEPVSSINHPSHYTAYKGIEVIQLTEQMNFNRGNAVKYIARAGLKNPDTEIEDLQKAAWYIAREIARISGGDE